MLIVSLSGVTRELSWLVAYVTSLLDMQEESKNTYFTKENDKNNSNP